LVWRFAMFCSVVEVVNMDGVWRLEQVVATVWWVLCGNNSLKFGGQWP